MNYVALFLFGVGPAIIWLAYFLRKDSHPEPNKMILTVFLLGMAATVPAIFLESQSFSLFSRLPIPPSFVFPLYLFLGVALVEELLKYGVVRVSVLKRKVVDEPIDIPLYMIIGALGFASLENTLILAGFSSYSPFLSLASLSVFRFAGAVFLHALVAGFLGVFIVMKRPFLGFLGAVLLHGLFNIYIIQGAGIWRYAIPIAIILFLASCVPFAISKLQLTKS